MALQLHLGCGKRYIPGFVHVDVANLPHIDFVHSIATLPMFEERTVDLIYCCHAFEYFDRVEGLEVLREWGRVLKPGGVLRLAVPDFEALAEVYRRHGDLSLVTGPLYGRLIVHTPDSQRVLYHRTTYDFPTLRQTLERAGFERVRRYEWRETLHRDYDDFSQAYVPHMEKERGTLISLNVEAEKPVGAL